MTLTFLQRASRRALRRRVFLQGCLDSVAWAVGLIFATGVRYDFSFPQAALTSAVRLVPLALLAQVAVGGAFGLYTGRWRNGSFEEASALFRSTALATVMVFTLNLLLGNPRLVPGSVPLAAGVCALVLMSGARFLRRMLLEHRRRPRHAGVQRVLVFGAGEGGAEVLTSMLRNPQSDYLPVGLLDDDPHKRNLRISGVPVMGGRTAMADAAVQLDASTLLIAVPSADAQLISALTELADDCGLDIKVLPSVAELLGHRIDVSDIRDITEIDLMGRHQVETDLDSIASYLAGKRVLVTGAGGSIGSELCRQLYRYAPSELVMLDRDESALHAVQLSLEGRALLDSPNLVLADIRDIEHTMRIFEEHRPQVVFHAAALKHLPLLERFPGESIKTNVWGTLTILETALAAGVERFVNISTDKAADPVSALGFSKRIAERLTSHYAQRADGTFLSVRFGNVLGSRGSVLTSFQAQIEAGGPITVTDPDVTRYFMTIAEAVQLVIQAGAIGRPGEALVLDMGAPVRISDVASRLASRADRPIKIVYTGLRPGEKLHEQLLGTGETDDRPLHPLISHVAVPTLSPDVARSLDPWLPEQEVLDSMRELCGTQVLREA